MFLSCSLLASIALRRSSQALLHRRQRFASHEMIEKDAICRWRRSSLVPSQESTIRQVLSNYITALLFASSGAGLT